MVAIALATFNGEKYIREQLDSLLSQTYKDFVCYIHDDGSSDNTLDIIYEYEMRYPNKFKVLSYKSFNSAKENFLSIINYIKEPYLMFCDQDDIWEKNKIEVSLNRIRTIEKKKKEPILVFTDLKVVDKDLNIIHNSFFDNKRYNIEYLKSFSSNLINSCGAGCTFIMNRELYSIVKKIKCPNDVFMHDSWVSLVASATGTIDYLNKTTMLYRQHQDNLIGTKDTQSYLKRFISAILRVFSGEVFKYYNKNHSIVEMFMKQAKQLSMIDEIPKKYKSICEMYFNLKYKNKLERVMFCLKEGIFKPKDFVWTLLYI